MNIPEVKQRYQLVTEESYTMNDEAMANFTRRVNALIAQGWEPLGAPTYASRLHSDEMQRISQAMYLRP